jgi:hypothetical protein
MSRTVSRSCTLRLAAEGRIEECSREPCAFWEPGGAVLEGSCLIDRLGTDVRQRSVAAHLLEIRERVGRAGAGSSREEEQ